MTTINILDMQTANLIAAGEVVDRPSSAVKELLENSIDAGATRVTVEIRNGGKTLMRVTDNGRGMSREDAVICVRRHATSKIRDKSDLDGISTLGFRGEALAAISAVSDMRILTKEPGSDFGSLITVKAGEVISAEDAGGPAGTTVIAENLFAQVPARRKFLRRDAAETASVSAVVEKVALSRPDISFKYIADGAVKFMTSGDGKLGSAIAAVLGGGFASKLIPVDGEYDGIRTRGYVGTPENVRATRSAENFFVNGRYVRCQTACAALEQAFSSYIPKDRFPVAVLRIDFSPSLVDVNVHPQKLEVRFSDERPVYSSVFETVRDALRRKVPIQSFSSFLKEGSEELLNGYAATNDSDSKLQSTYRAPFSGGRPSDLRDDKQLNGYAVTNDSDSKLQSTYRAP
ncbi:MAG: DNA mismatch repair endonuclease MutL, partial [Clostridia bacterium]|nr:DNA mismatch repair endonuclease MutL [Clostridia bacterium]